jgi:uncharacterized membrane protein
MELGHIGIITERRRRRDYKQQVLTLKGWLICSIGVSLFFLGMFLYALKGNHALLKALADKEVVVVMPNGKSTSHYAGLDIKGE